MIRSNVTWIYSIVMLVVSLAFSTNTYANSKDSDDVVKQWNQLMASISEYTAKKKQQTLSFFDKQLTELEAI